uniref:Uncharacterized protein n=1 Tax=Lotus japonicus TaxID=34305 RepID=I3S304_LOTJA|nr:unknown [Lotus japonicus]
MNLRHNIQLVIPTVPLFHPSLVLHDHVVLRSQSNTSSHDVFQHSSLL